MSTQWLTAIYSLLTCFGGGTLAFLGLSEAVGLAPKTRKVAAVAAALLLLAGGCVFVASVGRPSAVMAVATNAVHGSPKSLEFVAMLLCLVVAIVYLVVAFRGASDTVLRVVGVVALVLGVLMGVAAGHSAALGRASWCGWVLPVSYVGSALAMGGSLFGSVMAVLREEAADFRKVVLITLAGCVVQAVGVVAFGACSGFAVDALFFWGGAVAVGTVVPLICLAAAPKARALVFAALICSVAGAVCLRALILAMGTTSLGLIANAASRAPILVG